MTRMLRFDWNFVFLIINILVLYVLMRKFLFKPVLAVIEKRRQLIDGQFEQARKAQEDADALKAQYQQSLAVAEEESRQIVHKASLRSQEEAEKIRSQAQAEAERIVSSGRRSVEMEREKTFKELESQIAELAVSTAEKAAGVSLPLQADWYERFLKEVGGGDPAGD